MTAAARYPRWLTALTALAVLLLGLVVIACWRVGRGNEPWWLIVLAGVTGTVNGLAIALNWTAEKWVRRV